MIICASAGDGDGGGGITLALVQRRFRGCIVTVVTDTSAIDVDIICHGHIQYSSGLFRNVIACVIDNKRSDSSGRKEGGGVVLSA